MADLKYIKGVRTRYRNILENELQRCASLIDSDIELNAKEEILMKVNKCIKTLDVYREKLEDKSKELCCAIDDSDEDLVGEILNEDGILCEQVISSRIELEEFKDSILDQQIKHEERFDQSTVEKGDHLVKLQSEMQKMVMDQMKLQQEYFERQEKGRHDQSTVKLPKLEMIQFDGDKIKWTKFWDTFDCAVHSNKKLSDVEKLTYLMSKLTGEAKKTISGLALSNGNYRVAVKLLQERFSRKQEIIDLHYSHLMNTPRPEDTTESLRSFLNEIQRHLRSLEVLNQDVNQAVFVSMIKSKLPTKVLVNLK